MSIQATDDTSAAQAQRSAPRSERRPGAREAADFERALHKAGRTGPAAGDDEEDAPMPGLPDALPSPDLVRSATAATMPPRRPQPASGNDESRPEAAAVTPLGAGVRDARPAPTAPEPARGLLPSAAMQDALRAASTPAASATKESIVRVELLDARAPLHHIALQRGASGALDVQLGADARLRTPLAASADRLRTRLAERGASLASITVEGTDGFEKTDEN